MASDTADRRATPIPIVRMGHAVQWLKKISTLLARRDGWAEVGIGVL